MKRILIAQALAVCLLSPSRILAAPQQNKAGAPRKTVAEKVRPSYPWMPVAGAYSDPTSFFSLHGYVNTAFAKFGEGGNAEDATFNPLPSPGQLGLPRPAGNAGFISDFMIMIGSEITEKINVVYEHHWVVSGDANKLTEANVQWSPVKDLWVTAGLYWAPFGILNSDWLQLSNLFATVPIAARVFPYHSNVTGLRVNWDYGFNEKFGVNAVVSIDNGASGMGLTDQDVGGDSNDHKQFQGRLGFFPGLGSQLDMGYSFAVQRFRNSVQARSNRAAGTGAANPLSYPGNFYAHGLDLITTWFSERLNVRSYYVWSGETLEGDPALGGAGGSFSAVDIGRLDRQGYMAEASYAFLRKRWSMEEFSAKVRYDQAWVDNLAVTAAGPSRAGFNDRILSLGLEVKPHRHVRAGIEYHYVEELGRASVDNNGVAVRLGAEF